MSASLESLRRWCSHHKIWIDHRIEIVSSDLSGIHLVSQSPIAQDTILVKIPREAVISLKTSRISRHIPASASTHHGRSAQLWLALALSVELALGPSSEWAGYLQSLPRALSGMPLFWLGSGADGASALDFLKGTEAWRLVNETDESGATLVEDIDAFFEAVARGVYSKVLGSSSVETLTRKDFALAYGLVSSRAFLIDAYHGLAMVPIADAFNHVQENHVHLQSDYEVCPECGSLRQCIHDGGEDLPSETWEDDCLEMISNRPIESGVEVFNTYGEMLSNAQLLLQYGFILDGNENDRVTWTCDEMAEFVHSSLHWDPAPVRQTTDWLQSLPWEILEESSELVYIDRKHAFCVNADGTVSHGLWLYLATALVCSRTDIRGPTSAQEAILSGVEHLLRCQSGMEQHESPEHISGYTTNGSTIHQLSGLIFSLCRARSAGISRGEPTIRELGELLDSLPEDSAPSRRMAVSLALTEKSILETCMFTWQSLAETFVHVSDSDG